MPPTRVAKTDIGNVGGARSFTIHLTNRSPISVGELRAAVDDMVKICRWNGDERHERPTIGITRARVTPSRRAIVAWLGISPASSWRRHSMAFRGVSTMGGRPGGLCSERFRIIAAGGSILVAIRATNEITDVPGRQIAWGSIVLTRFRAGTYDG